MNVEQLALQLGLAGLLLLIGYRIAMLLISNWREAERERTAALAIGFAALVNKVDVHHTSDLESHRDMADGIAGLNGKLDAAMGWTPVRGVPHNPPNK